MKPPTARRPSLIRRLRIDAHAAWLAARDPRCPRTARVIGLLVTAYALSPIDLISDFVPILGLLDDVILVPAGLWLFVKMLPPGLMEEHRIAAEAAAERPRSSAGILIVLAAWGAGAFLVWHIWNWNYA